MERLFYKATHILLNFDRFNGDYAVSNDYWLDINLPSSVWHYQLFCSLFHHSMFRSENEGLGAVWVCQQFSNDPNKFRIFAGAVHGEIPP